MARHEHVEVVGHPGDENGDIVAAALVKGPSDLPIVFGQVFCAARATSILLRPRTLRSTDEGHASFWPAFSTSYISSIASEASTAIVLTNLRVSPGDLLLAASAVVARIPVTPRPQHLDSLYSFISV
jgi:hypothetical protein